MDGSLPSAFDHQMLDADIAAMRQRISAHVRRTPLIVVSGPDLGIPVNRLALKLEHLQCAATFKTRAAFADLLTMGRRDGRPVDIGKSGYVAVASQGNFGVALAYAAQKLQLKARVFVPDGVPRAKLARIRGYGADIVEAGRHSEQVLTAKRRWVEATGAHVMRSDSANALLGCATLAAEIDGDCAAMDRAEDRALDTLLVPVGSGALIAGLALGARPGLRLIGVEPMRAATLSNALAAGTAVSITPSGIAADTLGAQRICSHVLSVARRRVAQVVLVSDAAIVQAQKALWSELRLHVEPGAAVGIAALQCGAYRPSAHERVGVLLTGANANAGQY